MKRIIWLVLSCILLLTGCSAAAPRVVPNDTIDTTVKISEDTPLETFGSKTGGFRLTYPASFDLTSSNDDDYYEFTDPEQDLSISLTIEENTYSDSDLAAEEYPKAMGLEMYSKMLSENSFDRDIYVKDEESTYSIYSLTDEYIYCVEYTYQGKPGQDALIPQLDLEVYGDFSGTDDSDTLMSYALVHLEDLFGDASNITLVYDGSCTINSYELTVFQAYKNDELICLVAVNNDGICYVDNSTTGDGFINIELLLYDTTENTTDRLMYYAEYYYDKLYGNADAYIYLYNADYYFNDQHFTVYEVSMNSELLCHIGVTDAGVGYVDYSGTCKEFVKIEY